MENKELVNEAIEARRASLVEILSEFDNLCVEYHLEQQWELTVLSAQIMALAKFYVFMFTIGVYIGVITSYMAR